MGNQYRIACVERLPINAPINHTHIVAVGIDANGDGNAETRQTKEQVIENIRRGAVYYTIGSYTGKRATVEVARCNFCPSYIIKTRPDSTKDDNLDSLRACNWIR